MRRGCYISAAPWGLGLGASWAMFSLHSRTKSLSGFLRTMLGPFGGHVQGSEQPLAFWAQSTNHCPSKTVVDGGRAVLGASSFKVYSLEPS